MQSNDLQKEPLYADSQCRYLGGDPRSDQRAPAAIEILDGEVKVVIGNGEDPPLRYPRKSLLGVHYDDQQLGPEQAEYEEGMIIGELEHLCQPTAVLIVRDPENVEPHGFKIRFGFRNAYYAKLFAKRCHEFFGIAPF